MSDWTLLNTSTASGASSVEFTDLTGYKIFKFVCIDIHPSATAEFQFQANASGQSGYNETITSTYFKAYHEEGGSVSALTYEGSNDQAQGTGYQDVSISVGAEADESCAGELFLFNPQSTTYVKHFYSNFNENHASDYTQNHFCAGYFNVTSALSELSFKCSTGTFDGVIKQYGLVAS